jgi:peptidoglycan hydrolase-like protein with peptidoglycan-binding domain
MRRGYLIGGAAIAGSALLAAVFLTGGSTDADGAGGAANEFEAVEVRDLEEVTSLDGTLGFPEGDPITSRLRGTITLVAPSGTVVEEGDLLFAVDGDPVTFLEGSLPAFRDLGSEPATVTIRAQAGGIVTSLPNLDEIVEFNDEAFRINDLPVLVLPGPIPAWRTMDEGDTGLDVAQLEAALVSLGFDPGSLAVDESFTSYTDAMVDAWQESVGLEVDGRFSLADAFFTPTPPKVSQLLVAVGDSVSPGTPIMVLETIATDPTRVLDEGDRGLSVRTLQELLSAAGFEPGDIDGTFGSETEDAVEAFQTDRGLDVSGIADAATWEALIQDAEDFDADADVLQLQQALQRLGYSPSVDGVVDEATTDAIRSWQSDIGAAIDGVVDLGEVVFLPTAVRVTEPLLTIGSPVNDGSSVLATSDSASVIQVDLPADDQELLSVGLEVVVEMPDGSEVGAVVTDISGIATRNSNGEVVFETTIELIDTTVGAELDQAPVEVRVVTDARTQVLAVPVTALLALAEGGYAVEVDRGDGVTGLVAVEPGLYADGWVEVETAGLAGGDMVVVP